MSDTGRTEAVEVAVERWVSPSRLAQYTRAERLELCAVDVLAAADAWDREHGIVRVDTRDEATVDIFASWISSQIRGWGWNHISHEGDRQLWRAEAAELLAGFAARRAAVGAQGETTQ